MFQESLTTIAVMKEQTSQLTYDTSFQFRAIFIVLFCVSLKCKHSFEPMPTMCGHPTVGNLSTTVRREYKRSLHKRKVFKLSKY